MITRWPVPAAASSPIPAVLVKLGPLDTDRIADLRPYFDSVPDPRARRGRWYSLTAILLVSACAVVSGARSIDELAEWGQRASNALLAVIGIRRHLLRWRRTPAPAGRSRRASSREPAATWSKTVSTSPEPAGACPEPRPY
ncbi:transposase family protein [Streptomyces sp. NPDC020801]|uniref:transposase family protein n=1 Tax=Streptomyces sp. NPDC020801 TaxID=3365093 RepID=UPI0037AE41C1